MKLNVIRPGRIAYDDALAAQIACLNALKARDDADVGTLFLLEHPPVITLGRGADRANILAADEMLAAAGVTVHQAQRGGDVTYHGPGQIVGYPIIKLASEDRDVHRYLRRLEKVIIDMLATYGIDAGRCEGYTGVWMPEGKVAAIGVAISRWVTYHGFALNVAPDFTHFTLINPCGITDKPVTSMQRLLEREVDQREVEGRLIESFAREFHASEITETDTLPASVSPDDD